MPAGEIEVTVPPRALELLLSHGHTLALSEGACGGLLSAALVAHEGASRFFDGTRMIYSLKSRLRLSGWDRERINEYTGPCVESAQRLARTLRMEFGSPWVLCETGYAGPHDAGTGKAFFAVIDPQGRVRVREVDTGLKDRVANMFAFAQAAVDFLGESLEEYYLEVEGEKQDATK